MEVEGFGERLDQFKAPAVMQRRYPLPRGGDFRWVDLRHHEAGLGAALGQNATPRIDDQGMPKSLAAIFVLAALRGGENKAAVFDRAGALQHVPMCFAGLPGKGGRNRQEGCAGFGQRAVQRGKAQIVTHRQAEAAPR